MAKKKSKPLSGRKIAWALLAVTVIGFLSWWWYKSTLPDFIRYDAFGIDIPTEFSIHGIDVSKYQERINWGAVKEMEVRDVQIRFAFIKATEGLGNMDACFKRNWEKAGEAGLPRGAYHFFIAPKSGAEQAENFIRRVELAKGDLPPVLDVEQTYGVSSDKLRTEVHAFLDRLETHYGVKPIIYTNVEFYNRYLKDEFDQYPLWVAHYLKKDRPRIARTWAFWQYSESGNVNGIRGQVDFNVFNGDSTEFQDLLID
ncbi:glycoside hydrolase family 25 protein [Flavihumibacter profundi]|jgi:lysozyme|uniref:glycoside hydrolase family 25 protein n=1 Tax=Flavihumibacter profundi TaxID=2716883 RepID=UPI001CC54DF8|nr:glycoside hydrolase family 25 protein [Flavihumibacter profundi]MBZ5857836.1 glycoside hydrolase family 25 protein [Flavihumibacter profundi]